MGNPIFLVFKAMGVGLFSEILIEQLMKHRTLLPCISCMPFLFDRQLRNISPLCSVARSGCGKLVIGCHIFLFSTDHSNVLKCIGLGCVVAVLTQHLFCWLQSVFGNCSLFFQFFLECLHKQTICSAWVPIAMVSPNPFLHRLSFIGTLVKVWTRWNSPRRSQTWMIWSLSISSTKMPPRKRRVNLMRKRVNMMDEPMFITRFGESWFDEPTVSTCFSVSQEDLDVFFGRICHLGAFKKEPWSKPRCMKRAIQLGQLVAW